MQQFEKIPQHLSIIMDGNGRWATDRRLPRVLGHRAGAKTVRQVVELCARLQVPVLSLFALSVENRINRPEKELNYLLSLFLEFLRKYTAELHKNNIRIEIVGDRSLLKPSLLKQMQYTEQLTAKNKGLHLIVAIDYSGRWDILNATRRLLAERVTPEKLNELMFSRYLAFSNVPEPDLLIRTSGEERISNFMLWQLAYTELYFTDKKWPDFDESDLYDALHSFQNRERRFGYTSQQLGDKVV